VRRYLLLDAGRVQVPGPATVLAGFLAVVAHFLGLPPEGPAG
jgi:hypothetical protein